MKVRAEVVNALSEYFARDGVGYDYQLKSGEIVKAFCNYQLQHVLKHELGLTSVSLLDVSNFKKEGFRVEYDAILAGTDGRRRTGQRTRVIVVRR